MRDERAEVREMSAKMMRATPVIYARYERALCFRLLRERATRHAPFIRKCG